LAALAHLYGCDLPAGWLEQHSRESGTRPVNLWELREGARVLGIPVEALTVTFSQLRPLDRPFIAHLRIPEGHFVTVERITAQWVRTLDSRGNVAVGSPEAFRNVFSGHILAVWRPHDLYQRDNRPHLEIRPPAHDFGRVVVGERVQFEFEVHNVGRLPLQCSVLTALPDLRTAAANSLVASGQSTPLRVEFTPDEPVEGGSREASRTFVLATNDPLRPRAYVTIEARVVPPLRIWPKSLYFHRVPADQASAPRTVEIFCARGSALGDVRSDNPHLALAVQSEPLPPTLLEEGDYAHAYKMSVSLKGGGAPGAITASVFVHTQNPNLPPVRIPLHGQMLAPVRLSRPKLFFGFVRRDQRPTLSLELTSDPPRGFEVTEIVAPLFLEVKAIRLGKRSGVYRLEATLDPARLSGIVQGEIVVHTNVPAARQLRLPYYAQIVRE